MKYRIAILTMIIGFLALIGAVALFLAVVYAEPDSWLMEVWPMPSVVLGGVAVFCYIIARVIVGPPTKQPPKSLNEMTTADWINVKRNADLADSLMGKNQKSRKR